MPSIAIVGNAPGGDDVGSQVDACDEVVRFSHCNGWGGHTGSKTTIWVQRSDDSVRGPQVLQHDKETLDRVLPDVHTAYLVCDYFNHQRRWIMYNAARTCRQYPFLAARIQPLSARQLVWVHPFNHPTSGLVFLHYLLHSSLFRAWPRHLVGFSFVRLGGHAPEWEQAIVENWIVHGHFRRMP